MLQRNVDGVAVMTFGIEEELVQKLVEREFPLVFVDAGPNLPNIRVSRSRTTPNLVKIDIRTGVVGRIRGDGTNRIEEQGRCRPHRTTDA